MAIGGYRITRNSQRITRVPRRERANPEVREAERAEIERDSGADDLCDLDHPYDRAGPRCNPIPPIRRYCPDVQVGDIAHVNER